MGDKTITLKDLISEGKFTFEGNGDIYHAELKYRYSDYVAMKVESATKKSLFTEFIPLKALNESNPKEKLKHLLLNRAYLKKLNSVQKNFS